MLKVREHSELLFAQYLARCLKPGNVCHSITTRETFKRRIKETPFTRHRNTVYSMMLANNRKATLQAIHSDAVNKAVKGQKKNIVLYGLPHPINDSEKDLTRKERATLAQLRSGYWKLLVSYKSRIMKDASLDVYADCSKTPHDVKHLFACPSHPTILIPSDLWSKPVESIREFSLDWDEPIPKANNNNWPVYFINSASIVAVFYSTRVCNPAGLTDINRNVNKASLVLTTLTLYLLWAVILWTTSVPAQDVGTLTEANNYPWHITWQTETWHGLQWWSAV